MKTMQELAPVWTKAWDDAFKQNMAIPLYLDNETVNGRTPSIDRPVCCFIGEVRGGDCYYGKSSNDYCEQCHKYSMRFFDIVEDIDKPIQHKYEKLCQEYEEHFNKEHNGDGCET